MYYLQSRYYDPEIGRFINADGLLSTGQGILGNNMYAYCLNNPINLVDDTGGIAWWIVAILIAGPIIGGILGACSDEKLGDNARKEKNTSENRLPEPPRPGETTNSTLHENNKTLSDNHDIGEESNLTTADRISNALIGAGLGLYVSGALVSGIGAMGAICAGSATVAISVLGATGQQVFAIGAVVYDIAAMLIGAAHGMDLDIIEYSP